MGQALKKFVNREQRYLLRPEDGHIMSFARQDEDQQKHTTTFLNLSASGAAFLVHKNEAPPIGTMLKVEFPIPGEMQTIAWWAKVVRIADVQQRRWWASEVPVNADEVVIGIAFKDLPESRRNHIRKALHKRFNEILKQRRRAHLERLVIFVRHHAKALALYTALAAAVFGALYFLSRPTSNYDSERGAPWGERFNF